MRNTTLIVVGVLLVTFGTAALLSGKLSYHKREKVVEVGPLSVTADTEKTMPISPIVGGIGVACGAVLVVVGARKS